MRVLIAFDKFKGSLGAAAACEAASAGLAGAHPGLSADCCPLSDGGDGFAEVLVNALGGRMMKFPATGPLGAVREAGFGVISLKRIPESALTLSGLTAPRKNAAPATPEVAGATEASVAVIGLSAASGLALLEPAARDPWRATTLGTGELIRIAAQMRVRAVILGLGGSATHDLGLGALSALGFKFRDAAGRAVHRPVPSAWDRIADIGGSPTPALPPLILACDVSSPLLGPRGAAHRFARQKGLREKDLPRLEAATAGMAALLTARFKTPPDLAGRPGAGAAGGTAFGLMAATGAACIPGFELVAEALEIGRRIREADVVLTGEGRFDATSLEGKGPGRIVRMAREAGKPVHVLAGTFSAEAGAWAEGLGGVFLHRIAPDGMPENEAMARAAELLTAASAHQLAAAIRPSLPN